MVGHGDKGSADLALKRLAAILPLVVAQRTVSDQAKDLHQQILHTFVAEGGMISRTGMAKYVDDVDAALAELRAHDLVTLSEAGVPVGAYPFTADAREHEVRVNGHCVHAMCALDALAISPMFDEPVRIVSRCRVTADVIDIHQSGDVVENLSAVGDVCVGIDWGASGGNSCCANSLCLQMPYLRDGEIAQQWCAESADSREIFTLLAAIELARRFFVPLLR